MKKILMVDDDADLQNLVKRKLEANGFTCTAALSVEEGLEKLKEESFNLVLLDLGFQHANGSLFLKCAQDWTIDHAALPPIVVISGFRDASITNYVFDLGAVRFLQKPFGPSALMEVINDCIQ